MTTAHPLETGGRSKRRCRRLSLEKAMKNKFIVGGKKRFSTLAEACAYAAAFHRRTGIFVSVEAL